MSCYSSTLSSRHIFFPHFNFENVLFLCNTHSFIHASQLVWPEELFQENHFLQRIASQSASSLGKCCQNGRLLIGNKSGREQKRPRPMSGQRWSSLDQGRMEGKVFSVSSLDLIKSFLSGTGGCAAPRYGRCWPTRVLGEEEWDWPFVRSERRGTSNVPKTRALPCQRTFGRKNGQSFYGFIGFNM